MEDNERIEIVVAGRKFWVDYKHWNMESDWVNWGAFNHEKYWEKYPESKPDFPKPKVTKDYET